MRFIEPELLILIPVLYLIGFGLKKSKLKDELIPLLLGLTGIVMASIYVLAVEEVESKQAVAAAIFTAITQGILCAGASVYVNQIIKQIKKIEDSDEDVGKGE